MTVDDFTNRIEELTRGVQTNAQNSAWQFAAERLVNNLKQEIGASNLSNSLGYILEGSLISIFAANYILYQNYGVAGAEGNPKGAVNDEFAGRTHKYGVAMPPASVFSRYTQDPGEQFAIAKSVYKFGVRPKRWFTKDSLATDYAEYAQQFFNDNL